MVDDKEKQPCFFEKIFLLAKISIDVTFKMLFYSLSNVWIDFNDKELKQKAYTLVEALSTTRQID